MQEEENIFTTNHDDQLIMNRIVMQLEHLESLNSVSPLDNEFNDVYTGVLRLYDDYQKSLVAHSDYSVSCSNGCSTCCNHWVEDVKSFEADIIADYIIKLMPDKVQGIRQKCIEDNNELQRIKKLVDRKLDSEKIDKNSIVDKVDLQLSVFYGMCRPCPLITETCMCSIYPVRPLTCRMYVSLYDPGRCDPESIYNEAAPTCIIDVSKITRDILEKLHERYIRVSGDTGLRSLLAVYLA